MPVWAVNVSSRYGHGGVVVVVVVVGGGGVTPTPEARQCVLAQHTQSGPRGGGQGHAAAVTA